MSFSNTYIAGSSNTSYWYVNSASNITNNDKTYDAYSLYHWDDSKWVKVASANALGRSVGLLQQKSNEISASVATANGTISALNARVTNDEAQTALIASATEQQDITITNTTSTVPSNSTGSNGQYYAVGTTSPYKIYKKVNGTWVEDKTLYGVTSLDDGIVVKKINVASIVNAVNSDGSSVSINADKINFTGFTTFLRPSDVSSGGTTTIDGGRITTGTINAARLNIAGIITSINNNTTTTIDGGKITANTITSNQLSTDAITSNNYIYVSGHVSATSSLPTDQATGTYYSVGTSNAIYQYNGSSWVNTNKTASSSTTGTYYGTKLDLVNGEFLTKNFYIDASGNVTANNMTLNGGTIQSSNYISGTQGTKINLSDGSIDSKNFKVSSAGTLTATGASVTGAITATSMDIQGILKVNGEQLVTASQFSTAIGQLSANYSNWNGASTYTSGLSAERSDSVGNGFTSNRITADYIYADYLSGASVNTPTIQFPASDSDTAGVKITNSGITAAGTLYRWTQILNGSTYTLPTASADTLGGIKVGNGLAMNTAGTLRLETATTSQLGGVKVDGSTIIISNGVISSHATASISPATTSTLGGVIVGAGLGVTSTGIISMNRATTTSLGGIIVGAGLNVSNGSVSLASATTNTLGGVMVSPTFTGSSGDMRSGLILDNGYIRVTVGQGIGFTSGGAIACYTASSTMAGVVKIGTGLTIDSSGILSVSGGSAAVFG